MLFNQQPATYAETQAIIGFGSSPTTYGTITIIPVGYVHPATTNKPASKSLTFFWRIISSGFTSPYSVTHTFVYSSSDVQFGTLANYVPSLYDRNKFTWNSGNQSNINTMTYTITDWTILPNSSSYLDADYTAGDNTTGGGAFGSPNIFYSYNCPKGSAFPTGQWSNSATWSLTSHKSYSNPLSVIPGANDIVLIGNQDSVYLTNATYGYNSTTANCASLQIDAGSALDIDNCPGSIFSMVVNSPLGNGDFRVSTYNASGSTFAFPTGDFSAFNTNLGTTELYTNNNNSNTTYWLPQNVSTYGNLKLSPLGGSNIIFGNLNITIYGNLTTNGSSADSWFCPTWTGAYPTIPTVPIVKTITINGNLNIQGGAFIWEASGAIPAQNIVVNGDVIISPLSALFVNAAGVSQTMSIGGSLINNADGITHGRTTTNDKCDFTNVPLLFFPK